MARIGIRTVYAAMAIGAALSGTSPSVSGVDGVGFPPRVETHQIDSGPFAQLTGACYLHVGYRSAGLEAPWDAVTASGTPQQPDMAEWAIDRFAAAGLQLPEVEINFPEGSQSGCDGSPGRAYLDHEPVEVRICWNSRLILLHELAHVWEANNVASSLHEPFMAMRAGVKSWAGLDDSWRQRGREHAANVIAWGLLEDPYPIPRTYPNDADSLMAAFRLLTGTDPLHDVGTDHNRSIKSSLLHGPTLRWNPVVSTLHHRVFPHFEGEVGREVRAGQQRDEPSQSDLPRPVPH